MHNSRLAILGACGLVTVGSFPAVAAAQGAATDDGLAAGNWLVHLDAVGIFKHSSADISVAGTGVPGASISSPDDVTLSVDANYFLTPNFAIDLVGGIPPRTPIKGAGSIGYLGTLATTSYAPAVLSVDYHLNNLGRFHPYAGIGLNYTLFFRVSDGSLHNVKFDNAFGVAFKLGVDYDIDRRWTANFYALQILLGNHITASIDPAGTVPAVAKATTNPTVVGAGIGYRF
jgi:outer membrane protein